MDNPDYRTQFTPAEDAPDWFWDIIDAGKQDRKVFASVLRSLPLDRLSAFIRKFRDLVDFFSCPPFSTVVTCSGNHLQDCGQWVVSQGKAGFLQVWNNPAQFADVVHHQYEKQMMRSYGFVAEGIWRERTGEAYPH